MTTLTSIVMFVTVEANVIPVNATNTTSTAFPVNT